MRFSAQSFAFFVCLLVTHLLLPERIVGQGAVVGLVVKPLRSKINRGGSQAAVSDG